MRIVDRIKIAGQAFRSGEYWQSVINATESGAGINVTESNALTYSAVYASIVLSSETMSTVPLQVFKKTTDGREVDYKNPLYKVLHDQANRVDSAQQFREDFLWNIEMAGIGCAEIVRDRAGRIKELWNISPSDITEIRLNNLSYEFVINGETLPQNKIFFCYGPGRDGITPRSRLKVAKDSIGLGIAMQQFGGKYFKNGTNVGGYFEHPSKLNPVAYDRLKDSIETKYTGNENSHKSMILEEGMKFTRANMSNEDSQFLESRKFQISDIARFFGVKAHMIGDLENATYSNIEQQGIEAVTYCWRPRAIRLEQAINMQLINDPNVYAEHNLNGLMQGDLKSQADSWHIFLQDGVFNADEVRSKLNMNNQPDGQGQIYLAPLNMVNKEQIIDPEPTDIDDIRALSGKIMANATNTYGLRFNSEEYKKSVRKLISSLEKRGFGDNDHIRMKEAFKLASMQASGVKQVRWKSDPACKVCQHLNGTVVDIGKAFEGRAKQPPLADGCICSIEDADLNI